MPWVTDRIRIGYKAGISPNRLDGKTIDSRNAKAHDPQNEDIEEHADGDPIEEMLLLRSSIY